MPQASAEAKGASRLQERTDHDVGRKLPREQSRGGGKDAKRDSDVGTTWIADPKQGQSTGGGRGRILSSLSKQTSNTCVGEMPAFSSLPSPSADSGKLAPLDLGQRSPRSHSAQRSSRHSQSQKGRRDLTPEKTDLSSAGSGSTSPRSVSPRLPPMKTVPCPSNDDSSLPALGLSPRKGAQSARRVRSLSPNLKRASCGEPVRLNFANPEGAGGGGSRSGGRFSLLLDAKENEPKRGLSDPRAVGDFNGSTSSGGRDRDGDSAGCGSRSNFTEGGIAEAKADRNDREGHDRLPGTKSTSPPRERGEERRRSSAQLPNTLESYPPTNGRFKRGSRESVEELAHETRGSSPREDQGRECSRDRDDRMGRNRFQQNEEKEGGNTPNSPSTGRGEESSKSPRTRRMRPQGDSVS